MKKKLQVFISSTYNDMLAERQAAVEAILLAGHIPAGMELFAAGDESQLETIRRWIDDSDVFMLILGGRYGSIEPKSGKSYIELEYEYAAANKTPLFAAVISEQYLDAKFQSAGNSAIETVHGEQMKRFRETVKSKICRFFSDVNELKLIVLGSLAYIERNEGLTGWVRGSEVLDPKATLEEITRLQNENASLRNRAEELKAFFSALSGAGQQSVSAILTEDAKDLLLSAKNGNGYILYAKYFGGASLQTGGRNFINPETNPREEARWKAALKELVDRGLVEPVGSKGETYRLTKLGYDLGDEIEATEGNQA